MTRWWIFNAVGIAGVAVQLAVLHVTANVLHLPLLVATLIAVEAAILHNFAWHERWTWRERPRPSARWTRLAMFQTGNGFVSIAGNLVLMQVLTAVWGVPVLMANLAAIAFCSTINFLVSDTIVYRQAPR